MSKRNLKLYVDGFTVTLFVIIMTFWLVVGVA